MPLRFSIFLCLQWLYFYNFRHCTGEPDQAFRSQAGTSRSSFSSHTAPRHEIALDGPLSEITRSVIQAVLAEEGMNQSKAAKRLGISRSTLWRKLKP